MGRVSVKLSVGGSRVKTLNAQLNALNRELERVYQQGQSNNNTVSNRNLTNLQKHFGAFNQATSDKKDSLVQDLQQAQLGGNSRQINHILSQIEQLVEAQRASNQFFNSSKYQQIKAYNVSSSRRFAYNRYAEYNDSFNNRLSNLSHDIGFDQNREKILDNRWNTTARAGVMSAERYQSYQDYSNQLSKDLGEDGGLSNRLNTLREENARQLQEAIQQREIEQRRIDNGDFSRSKRRAGLDEQIKKLEQYRSRIEELTITLKKVNDDYTDTSIKIDSAASKNPKTGGIKYDDQNADITIQSPKDSLRGLIRDHKRVLIRAGLAGVVAGFSQSLSAGSNIRLNSFDDVKATAYARGGRDNHIENILGNAGYKNLGYDEESMAHYLNAFTSSTGNANLSDKQITNLTQAWGGLSRYSGAKDATTQNLEMIAGLTASYKSPGASASVANAIQDSITNSKMSAKADEQQSALASLYQFAGQGQSLSANDQKNLAGFQANMAKVGSDMQGQNGVQAYEAMANAFNYDNPTARALFGGFDPQYRTIHGQAALMEKMQNAKKDPSQYQTPIRNMLARARQMGMKTPEAQREVAAMNLVELSNQQLSMDQAKKLIKLEQEGKFSKKAARKAIKGNGKGQKAKYDLTSTKGLHKYLAAYHNMQRKTSNALDILRKAAARFDQSLWIAPIIGGAIKGALSSLAFQILPDIRLRDIWKVIRHPRQSARIAKDMLKHPSDVFKHILKDTSNNKHSESGILHTIGSFARKRGGKYITRAKELLKRIPSSKLLKRFPLLDTLFTFSDLKHGDFNSHSRRTIREEEHNGEWYRKDASRLRSRKGKVAIGVAGGLALGGYLLSNKTDASDRYGNLGLNIFSGGTTMSMTYQKMLSHLIMKRKHLHTSEWELIKYLNDYWDIFLRKVKESGGSSDDKKDDDSDVGSDSGDHKKDPEEWKSDIKKAAKAMGVSVSDQQVEWIVSMIRAESGGDPEVTQQISDINSARGDPAQGLLQFIPETFNSFAVKGHTNIKSGYDQLLALFNDSNWESDIHPGGGWGPTGQRRRNSVGGIQNHATGGNFGRTIFANNAVSSVDPQALTDLRTVTQMTNVRKARNYIKPVRNKPKFKVNIKINDSTRMNRSQIIDETISDIFNGWLANKQQQKLHYYYQNETSGQFV